MRQPVAEISGNTVSSSPVVPLPETVPIFVCQFKGSLHGWGEPQRFAEETGQPFDGLLSVGLDQRDLAVEIGLFLRMKLEGDAADRCDALKHCERVPGVLSVLRRAITDCVVPTFLASSA